MSLQAFEAWRRLLVAAAFGTVVLAAACLPALALGLEAPHVVDGDGGQTDTCAMCHRTHTSTGNLTWQDRASQPSTHSALLVSPTGDTGDTGFCYSCHGAEAMGANTDVQSSLRAASHHSVEPSVSAYGPARKQCSSCHDSHGSARTASGSPYPALLRSFTPTTSVNAGEEYCATCHPDRPADRWDGLSVYRRTAHYSAIPTPTTGTEIRCSVCHEPHGSAVAPLLQPLLTPPAVPATVQVTADDRSFCFDCHPSASATYPGRAAYQSSAHGLTSKPVTITGEWASAEATRAAGECQTCHAPMGRSDGAGGVIPKLAEKAGVALCLTCHTAAGPASTDFARLSYPATATPMEIVASWSPPTSTAAFSRLALYGEDPDSAVPRSLVGPREYRLPSAAVGVLGSGDIDGDGRTEIVAAKPGSPSLAVFAPDRLRGLAPLSSSLAIAEPADLLAVGDFLGTGRAQIAVVSRSDSRLRVYAYDSGSLSQVGGDVAVDAGASSIAAGDVTGTAAPDVVVTAGTAARLDIFTDDAGALASAGSFATGSGPTGASIGDAWPGGTKQEIVVLLGGGPGGFSIFDGAGTDIEDYMLSGTADLTPTASAVGDLLRSAGPTDTTSGQEIAVTLSSDTGDSVLEVYVQQAGGGYAPAQTYTTGSRYGSGEVTLGDVDGDGGLEAVVGNAGRWAVDADRQLPSIQVFNESGDGTVLDTGQTVTLAAGGVELAGAPPSLALANIGAGPSRHPWGVVAGAHVSTETAPSPRHVECTDCHEVHEATSTPVAALAPAASGEITGSSGVAVTNEAAGSVTLTAKSRIDYQYELCFKCHSGWVPLQGRADTAIQFDTKNASFHAVEGTASTSANSGTYAGSWGNSSVMYCTDCHTNADAGSVKGPHTSSEAPILQRPYLGDSPADPNGLCYKCHSFDVYYNGDADAGGSASFFATAGGAKLHSAHTSGRGLGCSACHVSHGSVTQKHLVGNGTVYTETADGGTCTNGCHPGGKSYAR